MPTELTLIADAARRRRAQMSERAVVDRRAALERDAHNENRARDARRTAAASQHRMRAEMSGAKMNRLYADFFAAILSPDVEIRAGSRLMRARARKLARDNPIASGFVAELANQVLGPKGITLQARVTRVDGEHATPTNKEIERGWKEWGFPETASADGRLSWVDTQQLIMRNLATDGEVLLRKLPYFANDFGFAVQFLDPDLLDENYQRPASPTQNEIRMGVEVDAYGRPVAYWLWNRHPSDIQPAPFKRERIDASEIIHKFITLRPGQTRGISWFAPVLLSLQMVDGYTEAELSATRMGAAKMGFIVNKSGDAGAGTVEMPGPEEEPRELEASPGLIPELPPGWEFQGFDPTHPSTAFKDFVKAILRMVARGLNMAYSTLTGDLEAVNYSSIRAGLLSERDTYRSLQAWLGIHICRPVYRDWLKMALLSSAIKVDSRLASDYFSVEWRGRGWKWVDPVNDLTAAGMEIALGLNTRSAIAAENGRNFEEMVDEIARENAYALEAGVDVSGIPVTLQPEAPSDPAEETDEPDEPGADPANEKPPAKKKVAAATPRRVVALIQRSVA